MGYRKVGYGEQLWYIFKYLVRSKFERKGDNKMKIKGKKLSYNQRTFLHDNGINDSENWLFVTTEVIDQSGYKRLSKNDPKVTNMIIQNKVTGEIKKIQM